MKKRVNVSSNILLCVVLLIFLSVYIVADRKETVSPFALISSWIDVDTRTVAGELQFNYTNSSDKTIETMTFFLPANLDTEPNPYIDPVFRAIDYGRDFESSHTFVVNTRVNGEVVTSFSKEIMPVTQVYSLHSVLIEVPLGELKPGESVLISLDFLTKIPNKRGDQSYSGDIIYWSNGWHPVALDPLQNSYAPLFVQYTADLLVPSSYVVVSNADYHTETSQGGVYKKVTLRNENLAPYLPLVAGVGLYVKEERFNGVDIYTYYKKGHEQEAVFALKQAADILEYYQANYGTYKKKRFSLVEGSSLSTPFSVEGLVCLPQDFYCYNNAGGPSIVDGLLSAMLAKEIAKSWFAQDTKNYLLDPTIIESLWLEEAFVNTLAAYYFEDRNKGSNKRFIDYLSLQIRGLEKGLDYHENFEREFLQAVFFPGLDEPLIREYSQLQYPEIWMKRLETRGYLTFRTLESKIGRASLEMILKEVIKKETFVDKKTFLEIAEKKEDLSLIDFWQNWVSVDQYEDLSVESVLVEKERNDSKNTSYRIYATVSSRGALTWPVELLWELSDGSTITTLVDLSREKVAFLESSKPVRRVTIDPKRLVLDVDRVNNSYPRKTEFFTMKSYSLESVSYNFKPHFELKPNLEGLEVGLNINYNNRFYNGYNYSLIYDTESRSTHSTLSIYKMLKDSKLLLKLYQGSELQKALFEVELEQKIKKDIGYTAKHNIKRFSETITLEYHPLIKNFLLRVAVTDDYLLTKGRLLSGAIEVSKTGGKLSFSGELIRPGISSGIFRTSFSFEGGVFNPLNKATTNFGYRPEKTGDYALTLTSEASVPLVLNKELARVGPLLWEDTELKAFIGAGTAFNKDDNVLRQFTSYIGGELLLGFNFFTRPFSLSLLYAKDLKGDNGYSEVRLSTRFYREVLGK